MMYTVVSLDEVFGGQYPCLSPDSTPYTGQEQAECEMPSTDPKQYLNKGKC